MSERWDNYMDELEPSLQEFSDNLEAIHQKDLLVKELKSFFLAYFKDVKFFWVQKQALIPYDGSKNLAKLELRELQFSGKIIEKKRYFFGKLPENSPEKKAFFPNSEFNFIAPFVIADKGVALLACSSVEEIDNHQDFVPYIKTFAKALKRLALRNIKTRNFDLKVKDPILIFKPQ